MENRCYLGGFAKKNAGRRCPFDGGRRALLEKTPANFPTIDLMAEELGMQERTLRRRLEAEGTTYRELLAGARKLLAIDYLRANKLKTMDIATRLGYSDVANFRNAFYRWTGHTPRHYRKQNN